MPKPKAPPAGAPLKSFGRRGGRPLSGRQKRLMETLLPDITIPIAAHQKVDPRTCFESADQIWLEIGFGGGEHVSGQASAHPAVGILASEVFFEGIGKLLTQVADQDITNVRIWPGR